MIKIFLPHSAAGKLSRLQVSRKAAFGLIYPSYV